MALVGRNSRVLWPEAKNRQNERLRYFTRSTGRQQTDGTGEGEER